MKLKQIRVKWITIGLVASLISSFSFIACEKDDDNDNPIIPDDNRAPVIQSLTASPTMLRPDFASSITASTIDGDGDAISHNWSASGGMIVNPDGATATWRAPMEDGDYWIYLDISDGTAEVRDSVKVTVDHELPYPAILDAPQNNATGVSLRPTLEWHKNINSEDETITFSVYFGIEDEIVSVATDITETSLRINDPIVPSEIYHWYVEAKNGEGKSSRSEIFSFTTSEINFGPPFHQIMFVNERLFISTVGPTGGGVTSIMNSTGYRPGYPLQWVPGSTAESFKIVAFNAENASIIILDESGAVLGSLQSDAGRFDVSSAGSKVACIRHMTNSSELIAYSLPPVDSYETLATQDEPLRFVSRPSYKAGSNKTIAAVHHTSDPNLSFIAAYNGMGEITGQIQAHAVAPTYSPDGRNFAYIEADNFDDLYIKDANNQNEKHFQLDAYGKDAHSLSWSPDGTRIALYAQATSTPRLVIIDAVSETMSEVSLGTRTIALSTEEDDLDWAAPTWIDNNSFTIECYTQKETLQLVQIHTDNVVNVLKDDVATISRPAFLEIGE